MKLNGNEKVELCAEKNNEPQWTISQLTLDELLNTFILGKIKRGIECFGKPIKEDIKYFSINQMILTPKTRINTKFRISLKKFPKGSKFREEYECVYTLLDVSDFYNAVVDLYYDYSEFFYTKIDNIKIRLIELEIKTPLAFTEKGFINSNYINQYDLDGQISILSKFLRTQKWEFINNKIVFTELINDKFIEELVQLQEKEFFINHQKEKLYHIEHCEAVGISETKKYIEKSINEEIDNIEKLKKEVQIKQEICSLNLIKYIPKFDKGGKNRWKQIL